MTNTNTNTTTGTGTDITVDTADPSSVVDGWLIAYAEPDTSRRHDLIAQTWAADGALIDPPFDGAGHEALSGLVDVVLTHYAGHTFRRTTKLDAHHDYARYGWELVAADGTVAVGGIDIVRFGKDGKLAQVVGFFGPLEPGAC
jgi:hypothetical protein